MLCLECSHHLICLLSEDAITHEAISPLGESILEPAYIIAFTSLFDILSGYSVGIPRRFYLYTVPGIQLIGLYSLDQSICIHRRGSVSVLLDINACKLIGLASPQVCIS